MRVRTRTGRGARRARWRGAAAAAVAAAVGAAPAAAVDGRPVVYAHAPAANAIHDAGVTDALRQAPILDDPRWPPARRLAKVAGRDLSAMEGPAMAAALRRAMSEPGHGGGVGVDEIAPGHWTAERAGDLVGALASLGPDARRVVFYASPAMVGQVGRADPRRPLPEPSARLVAAMTRGGAAFLLTYRGDLSPLPAEEMAASLTRWHARWPAGEVGRLRALIGPAPAGMTQQQVWDRVRATAAGRAILANAPGAYGLRDAEEGRAWAAALAGFRAAPDAPPPGGDVPVPQAGGLSVGVERHQAMRRGQAFLIAVPRGGGGNVRLVPIPSGPRRVFNPFSVPAGGGTVTARLPAAIRAGRYNLVVYFSGGGLEDRVITPIRVGPPPATGGLSGRLLASQRIAQAAIRRLNAVSDWLDAGLVRGDIRAGTLGADRFDASVVLAPGAGAPPEPASPRPIRPRPAPTGIAAPVRATPAQVLVNQRIAQAAVRRARALEERLRRGLTGGDVRPGEVTPGKLAPGLVVVATAPAPRPAPSRTVVAPARHGAAAGLAATAAQARINRRISEAALRRADALVARLEEGVPGALVRPGSLTSASLAPGG